MFFSERIPAESSVPEAEGRSKNLQELCMASSKHLQMDPIVTVGVYGREGGVMDYSGEAVSQEEGSTFRKRWVG